VNFKVVGDIRNTYCGQCKFPKKKLIIKKDELVEIDKDNVKVCMEEHTVTMEYVCRRNVPEFPVKGHGDCKEFVQKSMDRRGEYW